MKRFFFVVALLVIIILIGFILYIVQAIRSDVQSEPIRVFFPVVNSEVSSPMTVSGEARGTWFFEGSFPVKLINSAGDTISTGFVTAQDEWMTEDFVPFSGSLEFSVPEDTEAELILMKDNPSDLREFDEEYSNPVFLKASETMTVQVYFGNTTTDPSTMNCDQTYSTTRTIPKTLAAGRAALEELLKGPTESETENGFVTSINSGVTIQKLTIEDGIAYVDFDEQLQYQVGGSCRVAAIASQITETLKQFNSVDSVVISINGQTEDILQP